MKKKEFWQGFVTALVLAAAVSVVPKMFCRLIPWHMLPFQIELSRAAKLEMIDDYLDRYYVDEYEKELADEFLYAGMMAGVGDRYTYYLPEESMEQYMENANGSFDGIGIEVYFTQEGEVIISYVMPNEPAQEAGFRAGDVVIGVDGEDTRGYSLSDVASRIRGKAGTEVTVTVFRKETNETLELTAKRAHVQIHSVQAELLEGNIGYVLLSGFKENTYAQFKEELQKLQEQGMQGLILDLRNNPGGLVRSVYQIGEELLPEGTMVYTLDKKENRSDLKCDSEYMDIPLVLLVNENSASASEILAGAVKDTDTGTLVGTTTFGKGLVQRLFPLPDGSALNITIQKYYTPNGTSIHEVGVEPHESVDLPEQYRGNAIANIPKEADTQLQKAIEVMEKKLTK